jgi:hypothetical protein
MVTSVSEHPTASIFRAETGDAFFRNSGNYLQDYTASEAIGTQKTL